MLIINGGRIGELCACRPKRYAERHCRENLFQAHGEQAVDFPLTAACGVPLAADTSL